METYGKVLEVGFRSVNRAPSHAYPRVKKEPEMKRSLALILILCGAATAFAQTETTATTTTVAPATTTTTVRMDTDSGTVRQQFRELLDRHPPHVGRVLKMDPTLFNNPAYLATYPAIAAFLSEHPEIAHTPAYYLEGVWIPGDTRPETASERVWRDTMEGFAILLAIGTVVMTLTWIIKNLIEYRRWSRLSKVQAEVHNKLMDRFANNEELMSYIQTPAGKRFLESAPLQLEPGPRPASAPVARILWSVQVGLVILAAGLGLLVVSNNVQQEVVQPLYGFAVLAMSLGVGFIVSSFVSYILSRRLGLWGPFEEPSRSMSE